MAINSITLILAVFSVVFSLALLIMARGENNVTRLHHEPIPRSWRDRDAA